MSGGQPSHQIGDARPRCRNRYSGLAGHASDPSRNEGCILLVTADHRLNRGIDQRIEYFVDLCAWHSKNIFRAPGLKHLHDDISTCHCLFCRLCLHRFSFRINYTAFCRSFIVTTARFSFKNDPASGRRTTYSKSVWIPTRNPFALQSSTWPPFVRSLEMKWK